MIRLSHTQFSSQLHRLICTFGIQFKHTSLSQKTNSIFSNLCANSKQFSCISAGKNCIKSNSQVFVLSEGNRYIAGNSSQCNCSESGLLIFSKKDLSHSRVNSVRFISTSSIVWNQSQEKQTPKKKKMVRIFFIAHKQQVLVQGHSTYHHEFFLQVHVKLTEQERKEQIQPLLDCGWTMVNNRDAIYKEYIFKNFNESFGFMTHIAIMADKMDHHPEWYIIFFYFCETFLYKNLFSFLNTGSMSTIKFRSH